MQSIWARAMIAPAVFALAASAHAQFRTDRIFDLTLGVGAGYSAASDAVTGGLITAPAGFNTVNELFDVLNNSADLTRVNNAYTTTSAAVIRVGYRGLPMVLSTTQNSAAVQFQVPAIGESVTFNAKPTRDENMRDLREYLKSRGGDVLNRLQQALARVSPIDPVAGNPGSLQTQMVNDDFDRTFLQMATSLKSTAGQPVNNLIGVSIEGGTFTSGGRRTQTLSVPLSYTTRADADPRRQFSVYLPVTVSQVEGGSTSAALRIGMSYRYPINDNWAITPAIGYGVTGSVDLGSAAAMLAVSVTSHYAFRFQGFDMAMGNAIGVYRSSKFTASGYSIDPQISNTVFRNGLLASFPASVMGRQMAWEASYINTLYTGTNLYSKHYNELGLTLGTNRTANSSRSFLRAGITLYKGDKDISGGKLNAGYWF